MTRSLSLHSRRKLKPRDASRFAYEAPPLFAELAAAVCETGMLPEKELHECWQMAQIVDRAFPDSLRIADIAAGHGLLAWILVLLARKSEGLRPRTAVAVDITRPKSADSLAASLLKKWPELSGSVHFVEGSAEAIQADKATLFVAAHACGSLSDQVLLAALRSRSPLAIMPCCHSLRKQQESLLSLAQLSGYSAGVPVRSPLESNAGPSLVIDLFRKEALASADYDVQEAMIQPEITPFHRIILARPRTEVRDPGMALTMGHSRVPVQRSGQVRAFEKLHTLNVADAKETEALSHRPSREWTRFFDLSFWMKDEALVPSLHDELNRLMTALSEQGQNSWETRVTVRDQYWNPATQQRACTFRIEVRSVAVPIEKADALRLRRELGHGLDAFFAACPGAFRRRGD
ncbi:MAG TPA: methyltransferase [Oligoflexus sp.]|uniref:methyltransferase n=1 Tax=Oligoflexus sp. TaxID=1971216 RepID=UPI002D8017AB|nr:methyltransferase [Oligoflexus sp.]HET9236606.1 methyltransferase [Oligoflexus sp.]